MHINNKPLRFRSNGKPRVPLQKIEKLNEVATASVPSSHSSLEHPAVHSSGTQAALPEMTVQSRSSQAVTLRIGVLLLALAVFPLAHADSPSPNISPPTAQRDQEAASIREFAHRHAQSGASLATQTIIQMFHANPGGMTDLEIAQTYENTYQSEKETVWSHLGYGSLTLVGVLLLILGIVISDTLKSICKWLIERAGDFVHRRFAGFRPLRRMALGRYRKSIQESYAKQKLVFRPTKPLDMRRIFVPLSLRSDLQVPPTRCRRGLRPIPQARRYRRPRLGQIHSAPPSPAAICGRPTHRLA